MAESLDDPFDLDRLVHEPARFAILTVLSAAQAADLQFLHSITGLTPGNLSSHLSQLETAGLVVIERTFRRKRPYTMVRATPLGLERFEAHWKQLESLRKSAKKGRFLFRPRLATE